MCNYYIPRFLYEYTVPNTVEPLNIGHFGDNIIIQLLCPLYREVFLSLEVQNVLELYIGKQILGP